MRIRPRSTTAWRSSPRDGFGRQRPRRRQVRPDRDARRRAIVTVVSPAGMPAALPASSGSPPRDVHRHVRARRLDRGVAAAPRPGVPLARPGPVVDRADTPVVVGHRPASTRWPVSGHRTLAPSGRLHGAGRSGGCGGDVPDSGHSWRLASVMTGGYRSGSPTSARARWSPSGRPARTCPRTAGGPGRRSTPATSTPFSVPVMAWCGRPARMAVAVLATR